MTTDRPRIVRRDRSEIINAARAAWRHLKSDDKTDFQYWLKIGAALKLGREECLRTAGTNRPSGKRYAKTMNEWLKREHLGDIDQGDRSRLLELMDNLPAISEWRETLTQTERLRLNHPSSVLRKWQKATQRPEPRTNAQSQRTRGRARVANQDAEVEGLREQMRELEAAREAAPADLSVDALIAALEARVPDLPMREQVAIAEKLAAIVQRIAAAHPAPNRRRSGRRTAPGITIRELNLNARPTADGEEVDSEEEDDRRPRTRSRKAARAL